VLRQAQQERNINTLRQYPFVLSLSKGSCYEFIKHEYRVTFHHRQDRGFLLMQNFSISPRAMAGSFFHNRALIRVLVVREVAGRYRGSILGIFWSFFYPVFMLAV
jgi:hypothetical protein